MMCSCIKCKGFTLIEVLIAATILTISLLGLIVLQGVSKFSSYEARQRTIAMYVATDLQDRLRLNKTAWITTQLAGSGSTFSSTVSGSSLTVPDCAQTSGLMSNCSQADLVNLDLYSFQNQLQGTSTVGTSNAMMAPTGCIQMTRIGSENAANVTITVSWQSKEELNGTLQNAGNTSCGTGGRSHRQYVVRTVL
nr:type IV pilus modification protein PilV [uncultured Tolumonas sp.]